ncbi:MAG: hypothetical protein L0H84_10060 [Pseudonocardia sp.]|nr:hypothetical protein [Pseudonocardia sp.]
MKIKPLLVAVLTAAALAAFAPVAVADTPAPDCAAALLAYGDAAKAAAQAQLDDQAAADVQTLYDALAAAQAELVAAQAADEAAGLQEPSQRTKDAQAAVGVALIDVGKFEAEGVTIEQLRETAAKTDAVELAAAAVAAQAAADVACKGEDGQDGQDGEDSAPAAPVVVPDTSDGVDTGSW